MQRHPPTTPSGPGNVYYLLVLTGSGTWTGMLMTTEIKISFIPLEECIENTNVHSSVPHGDNLFDCYF